MLRFQRSAPIGCGNRIVDNAKALCEGLMEGGASLYTGGTDSHMVVAYTGDHWTQPALVAKLGAYGVLGNAIRAPGAAGEARMAFRLGTVAMTIRNLGRPAFVKIGRLLARIYADGPAGDVDLAVQARLANIAAAHPVPSYVD